MTEVHKTMHSVEKIDREVFLFSHNSQSHPIKLNLGRFGTDKREYFFTQHMVKQWNLLLQDVVRAANLGIRYNCGG